ncbi:DUF1549 domain-containing protein [Mariniblastus fucicola]|uniref:Bacterial Ig-like domain (Group 2) n=1 Tax=Mariniblastus fucicola TaxID=980251 RepID=A0A5B9PQA6_9BACT|nr:DUF1549 domain-containing protein [Mariniblastus fucicola]QEG24651.1 hypothetical protein MFFC18_45720 [Mariniblastus fucicola]
MKHPITILLLLLANVCFAQDQAADFVTFRNDVLPVLSKMGCNSGACHGALAGKGGFRLSLHGYDPKSDHFNITREARGRRLEPSDPGRSLLLTKPTGVVPHKGGVRFLEDSDAYRILQAWIASGNSAPTPADPEVLRVEIKPDASTIKKGDAENLRVVAHFSDGTDRDVTPWAKFTSANGAVTEVDQAGRVSVIGHGESAVTAWYSSKIGIARVTSPFPNQVDGELFASSPKVNFIDELVLEQLQRLNLPPSPPASDEVFLRRVFLDTIGKLPTPAERDEFLSSDDADKKSKLIDELLQRPEFVDYWTYQWSDLLLVNGTKLRPKAVEAFYEWIRKNVEANTPWDQFVREILTAKGSSVENGATNFYALHQDPENMAENASQAFLGLSIACAKCHNHPLEKWTNDQYYAFANMFSRVRAKGWGGDARNGDGVRTLFLTSTGELIQPITGKAQPPAPLDGEPLEFDDVRDRREPLADWMTSPENPYFARSITNRVWSRFFAVGLVEDVDDLRVSNPASNEKLLSATASYLIEKDFDLKELMRAILNSATYQRSSETAPGNGTESRFYSRYYPRRLMAEVLLDAVSDATDVPTEFKEILLPGQGVKKIETPYPKGTRAIQLYDSAVKSRFLKTFGRNDREITCECQRTDEPSMVQVLHIANGDTLNEKLESKDNRVDKLMAEFDDDRELIRQAYLLTLVREPTEEESAALLAAMSSATETAGGSNRRELVEDLFWSLMSSREFLFNH